MKALVVLAMALLLASCEDAPRPSDYDVREYRQSISDSGPGWRYWFPRPSWYPQSLDAGASFVSDRVIEVLAQCSGGVTISATDLKGVARSIEGRMSGGRISVEETKRSVIGINFGDKPITAQTVDLYRAFTECVTAQVNDNRQICDASCDEERAAGLRSAFSMHEQCMETRRSACISSCIRDYDIDPDSCRANFCRVETNMSHFVQRCDEPREEARLVEADTNYCKRECASR